MKKTLLITIDFPPMLGGVANYWHNLCSVLPSQNIVVLASEYNNSLNFDSKQNYIIYRQNLLSKKGWLWPKWLPAVFNAYKVIKKEKIEQIIVTHALPMGTVAFLLKKILRLPYFVSCHGLDVSLISKSKWKTFIASKIFNNAKGIFANSEFTKSLILKAFPHVDGKIEIIYPCPSVEKKNITNDEKIAFIDKNNFSGKKIVLTVARLVKRKGQDLVVKSLSQVLKVIPNAIYVIVGQGAEESSLRQLIDQEKLQDNVKLFTDIEDDELPYFYEASDVFIMTPRIIDNVDVEGFGIVYLEANLYKKPAIAGNSGGAGEAVANGVSGLVVDSENSDEIAEAIVTLLNDPKKSEELGERGYRRVMEQFTWEIQSKKLLKILE